MMPRREQTVYKRGARESGKPGEVGRNGVLGGHRQQIVSGPSVLSQMQGATSPSGGHLGPSHHSSGSRVPLGVVGPEAATA